MFNENIERKPRAVIWNKATYLKGGRRIENIIQWTLEIRTV
jgi:hypothetical protein